MSALIDGRTDVFIEVLADAFPHILEESRKYATLFGTPEVRAIRARG